MNETKQFKKWEKKYGHDVAIGMKTLFDNNPDVYKSIERECLLKGMLIATVEAVGTIVALRLYDHYHNK